VPCYHPLRAFRTPEGVVFSELGRYDIISQIELPCGQCIGCRMRRASDWELRVMHEASLWPENCFVTLTYAEGNLPSNASLEYRDFQLFMKRLRKHFGKRTVRFYMCGEYGELRARPHYHACLFNCDFDDKLPVGKSKSGELYYSSEVLSKLWGLGIVSVQPLVRETASYCARYIMKKVFGDDAFAAYSTVDDDGVVTQRRPEFASMSLRPGIGAAWFDKFSTDVFPHDMCVANGVERRVPRYYDKRFKRDGDFDSVEFERQKAAQLAAPDNSVERRLVREAVHLAKVSTLKRDL